MLDVSKLKYALFDWDNTLVESRSSLTAAVNIVLSEYGLPSWENVKQRRDANLSFKDNFPLIFGKEGAVAYERYRQIYLEIMPQKISIYPYVDRVLEWLSDRKISLYVVSNKERCLLEREKELLLPQIRFRKIVCGHEAPADKPSPEQIYYALAEDILPQAVSAELVWMIGDSPMDSHAALAAGALPIRIGRSIWGDEGEPDNKIVYFNDFREFYQNLGTKA